MGYIFGLGEDFPADTLPHSQGARLLTLGNRCALPFLCLPLLFRCLLFPKEVRQTLPDFRLPDKFPVGLLLLPHACLSAFHIRLFLIAGLAESFKLCQLLFQKGRFALQLILLACDEMLCGQGRTQSADCLCRHFQYAPVIEKRCFREWLLLTQQTFRLLGLSLIVGNALFQFRLTLSQSADGAERIPDKQQSIPGKAIVFFLLLLVLAGIQMLSGRAGLLFHAALNGKAAALQMERELALQFFQTCRVYILLAFRRPSRVTGT